MDSLSVRKWDNAKIFLCIEVKVDPKRSRTHQKEE